MKKVELHKVTFEAEVFEHLKEINRIYSDAKTNWDAYSNLEFYKNAGQYDLLPPPLHFLQLSHYKITIIELLKLLSTSRNEKFRFSVILELIKDEDRNKIFDPLKIDSFFEKLSTPKTSELIIHCKKLRDMAFAHTDSAEKRENLTDIFTTDINQLLTIAQEILDYLNETFKPNNDILHKYRTQFFSLESFYRRLIDEIIQ